MLEGAFEYSNARVWHENTGEASGTRRWIALLQAARKNLKQIKSLTVGQFFRELAKLGGFIGRMSDGEPGWITIWRGWQKLYLIVRGAELADTIR